MKGFPTSSECEAAAAVLRRQDNDWPNRTEPNFRKVDQYLVWTDSGLGTVTMLQSFQCLPDTVDPAWAEGEVKVMISACKQRRLERKRQEALLDVRFERSVFESMVLRAQFNNGLPSLVDDVRRQIVELEPKIVNAKSIDELEDLRGEAESLAHNRAYVCPPREIADEGILFLYAMAEWGLPRATLDQLHRSLGDKVKREDVATARSALRAIFQEFDEWFDYFDDYHDTMWRYTRWMLAAIIALTPLAILLVHYPSLTLGALFLAGMAGSCASVISKVPVPELRLSGELEGYRSRILSRIGAGTIVSLVASAIIGWGIPLPIQGETFSTILRSCSAFLRTSCTEFEMLFLLGVAMGFGFTERLVAHFEGPWFGQSRRRTGGARSIQGTTAP